MDFSFSWFLSRLTIAWREGPEPFKFYKLDNELKLQECNGENVFGNKMDKLYAQRAKVENAKLTITALFSLHQFYFYNPINEGMIKRRKEREYGARSPFFRKTVAVNFDDIETRSDDLRRSPRDTVAVSSLDIETRSDDLRRSPRDTVAVSSVDIETRLVDFKLSHLLLKEPMLKRWEKLYKCGNNEERAQYLLSVKHFLQKEMVSSAEEQSVLKVLKSVTMQQCSASTSNNLQGLSVY